MFGACHIMGQWGKFRVKNATLFKYSFLAFVLVAVVFHQKIGFFLFPFLFFDEVPHFHNRIFISQSETGIVDKNLSVELYDDHSLVHQ